MPADEEWVTLALILRTRGNRGEVLARSFTSGADRFDEVDEASLWRKGVERRMVEIEEAWEHQGHLVLKFTGVDSISAAELLKGFEVQVPFSERAPLDEGEHYHSDLLGYALVERDTGKECAQVTGFENFGAGPLLVVQTEDGREEMVPFTPAICVAVEAEKRRILVDLPEGLLDLNRT